jgi:4'-phosphopantetheinyl transferase
MNGVTIWTMAPDDISPSLWLQLYSLLDAAERERAARFAFEAHRRQHVAAHALKRLMLSSAVQGAREPAAWAFETNADGKPRVRDASGPHFNLSHCDGMVACAISHAAEIGIDVECLDRQPLDPADSHFLAASERAWLEALPEALRPTGFFKVWTLKEAYIKATGLGLNQRLDTIAFGFDPLVIRFADPALGDASAWWLEQKIIGSGRHILAAAWRAQAAQAPAKLAAVRPEALLA